jgi:hypothetical protein
VLAAPPPPPPPPRRARSAAAAAGAVWIVLWVPPKSLPCLIGAEVLHCRSASFPSVNLRCDSCTMERTHVDK